MKLPPKGDEHEARIAEHARRVAAAHKGWHRRGDMSAIQRKPKPKPAKGRPVSSRVIPVAIVGTGRRFASITEAAHAMIAEAGGGVGISAACNAIGRASGDGRPAFGRQWYRLNKPGVWWNRKKAA